MGMNPEQPPQYGQYGTPQPPQYETPQPHPWASPPPPPPPPPPYTAPPNYGAPYPQSQPAPPPPLNRWGPSSLGMDANLAAGLSYLATILIGPILAIIFFFVEKTNRFVKFHAAQVILLNIAGIVVGTVLWVLFIVFAASSAAATANSSTAAGAGLGVGVLFAICLFPLAALAFLGLWLWGMIGAFSGKYTKLPLIGNIAESWAGGPAMPMY